MRRLMRLAQGDKRLAKQSELVLDLCAFVVKKQAAE